MASHLHRMKPARRIPAALVLLILLVCLAILAALQAVAFAQEPVASIRGRVTDVKGQPIAAVSVIAQSPSVARPITTQTTKSGDYMLTALPPGPYVVSFSKNGLITVKRTMTLAASEAAATHVVMHGENGFEEAITVTGDRPVFPPSWTSTFESRSAALEWLPVTGTTRSAIGLVTDQPGVTPQESLFLMNGLPLRHGWGWQPRASFAGPGADALREVTVTPGRLPASYGDLQAGTIASVSPSGGNRFAGSFRGMFDSSDLNGDRLRLARDTEGLSGSAEYTLGGAILRDRTWFFAAGRHLTQSVPDRAAFTGATFETGAAERFGLAKVTHVVNANHRFEGQWLGASQRQDAAAPLDAFRAGDTRGLETRRLSDRVFSGAYFGRLRGRWDVSARYTREDGSTERSTLADETSLASRTPLVDQETGVSWWASGACTTCAPQRSTHNTIRLVVGTHLSTNYGAHYFTAGIDSAGDTLEPASVPAGGSYQLRATRVVPEGDTAHPVFMPGGSTWIVWRPDADNRVGLRSNAFFVGDRWSPGDLLTIDVGLRFERHRGRAERDDQLLLSESALSPRVAATWRPSAARPWTFTAGFGRYVDGVLNRTLDASMATQPATRAFVYDGPAINASGPLVAPADAIDSVFDWFFAQGGTARPSFFAVEPGVSSAPESGGPPLRVDEFSIGVSRFFSDRGSASANAFWRTYGDIPGREVAIASPSIDQFGQLVDSGTGRPATALERRYTGLSLEAKYRFGHYADVAAQYTLSNSTGNADEAALTGNPLDGAVLGYPEYFSPGWHVPVGNLPDDARHRLRFWGHSELFAHDTHGLVVVTIVYSRESGRPYGASALVGVAPFVENPGYQQPPVAARYFFTDRDAFRTETLGRTDLGFTYRRPLPRSVHGDLYVQFHILNVFDRVGVLDAERLAVTRTALTDPSLQPFNPFTETPVRGVHWTFTDLNTRKDLAADTVARTLGRAFRLAIGVRF